MSRMQMSVAHALTAAETRSRVDRATGEYGTRHPHAAISVVWKDETHAAVSFTVRGKTIAVAMTLQDKRIEIEADVPLLFRPFEGMIRSRVETEAAKWLK